MKLVPVLWVFCEMNSLSPAVVDGALTLFEA